VTDKEYEELVYKTFGVRVKSKRQAKGISQLDLAEAVGLSRTSLTNIENGRHKPVLHVAIKICQILKMKVVE
jgi:DNA-binding XRE family transcriptional regulator